jgi:serine/threonine-protein kinase
MTIAAYTRGDGVGSCGGPDAVRCAGPMLKAGDSFARYTIEALLGQGGMGAVYRAHDQRLDRRVALKVLAEAAPLEGDSAAKERLLREARAAAALDHPNAVAIYDVGEASAAEGEKPQPYIVMELVAGETLRAYVGDSAVPWQKRLRWMLDAARALGAAHDRGLVHRDIKPDNVMVRRDGVVKVLDFGIARRSALEVDPTAPTQGPALPTLTAQGVQVGTPLYMAPEQIKGDPVDGRTDQFAWAVCTYELLTGRPPWRAHGGALGLVASILTDEPPAVAATLPEVPAGIDAALRTALEKRKVERFPSMAALVDEIERQLASPAAGSRPPGSGSPPRPPGGSTDLQRYSTAEMREILQRALERQQERPTGFSREELVEAAREVGVDESAIAGALREVEARRAGPADMAERRRRALRSFLRHLASYLVVNVFLYAMGSGWNRFVLLGWGIAVALHFVNVVLPKEPKDEDEKSSKKKRRRDRPRSEAPAVEEGVSALLQVTTARARRLRVAASTAATPIEEAVREEAAREAQAVAEAETARALRRARR